MKPKLEHQRLADWCPTCTQWRHDEPGWAEHHNAISGHVTHRRTIRVETWEAP